MQLLLCRSFDPVERPGAGPIAGLTLPYVSRHGFPVGFTPAEIDAGAVGVVGPASLVPPAPGMVVVTLREAMLYVIDADGETHFIGLRAVSPVATVLERMKESVREAKEAAEWMRGAGGLLDLARARAGAEKKAPCPCGDPVGGLQPCTPERPCSYAQDLPAETWTDARKPWITGLKPFKPEEDQ